MAKGRKTGGRDFQPGDPRAGRPPGAKDKVPRSIKATIRQLYEEILATDREAVKAALRKKLLAGDHHHVQLAAYYLDGKPVERVDVEADPRPPFIIALREPIRLSSVPNGRAAIPETVEEEEGEEFLTLDPPSEEPPRRRWG